jgi:3-hydroxyacyl-CoA dehydrogenase/enoyl-CoA hydratase/3-hydroxybutyryl-CoA epimerase
VESPADQVINHFVENLGRIGKKAGKGFLDYPADGRKQLWPGLADEYPPAAEQPDVQEVIKRLMYIQGVETARCMEENVVTDPRDADVGSILGWGFAPFRGGVMSMVHTAGVENFVAECDRLAQAYGPRFSPPAMLRNMVAKGEQLYAA